MSKCVNLSSKEFKSTCKRLDIHPSTLELIVHKYQNTEGNENSFPSDSYIVNAIIGTPTQKATKEQLKLWEERYSEPKTFSSLEDAELYANEAKNFFDDTSIRIKRSSNNKYIVTVVKPDISKKTPSDSNSIYFQKAEDRILENKRDRVKSYYRNLASSVVDRKVAAIESLKKTLAIIPKLIKINLGNDTGYYEAEEKAKEIKSRIEKIAGSLLKKLDVKYNNRTKSFSFDIEIKDREDLIKEELQRANSFVDNMSKEALDSEIARLDSEFDSDYDLAYHIKAKDIPVVKEQIAKKNPYLTEEELNETIDFLVSLENDPELNLYVTTAIRWIKNKAIQLPRHDDIVWDLFTSAREAGLDIQKFNNPFDIVKALVEKERFSIVYEKGIDPFRIPQFRFVKSVTSKDGEQIDIFDVEDTQEGRNAVSQALADTTPKKASGELATGTFSSPWCLAVYKYKKETKKAQREAGSERMWDHYNGGKRQIAFCKGYPVAFNSSVHKEDQWWDYSDHPHDSVTDVEVSVRDRILGMQNIANTEHPYRTISLGDGYIDFDNHGNPSYFSQGGYGGFLSDEFKAMPSFEERIKSDLNSLYVETNYNLILFRVKEFNEDEHYILVGRNALYQTKDYKIELSSEEIEDLKNKYNKFAELKDFLTKEYLYKYRIAPKSLIQKVQNAERDYLSKLDSIRLPLLDRIKIEFEKEEAERIKKEEEERAKKLEAMSAKAAEAVIDNSINTLEQELGSATSYHGKEEYKKPKENIDDVSITKEIEAARDLEYINEDELEELTDYVRKDSKFKSITRKIVQRLLQEVKNRDYKKAYYEGVTKEVNEDLEQTLKNILEEYHFETIEADLKEVFGKDVLGATDFLNKVIYLANKGDRNALTGIEEFSHAFIKMMGSIYHKPENRDKFPETKEYSELRDLIEQTSLYKDIVERYKDLPQYQYSDGTPNTAKLKEEALGQALATVILERNELINKQDKNFFDKVKQWFKEVLLKFKGIFDDGAKLDSKLNAIADSILDGTYTKKYLQKLDPKDFVLQDFKETIERDIDNGGIGLSILQDVIATGGIVTGSLSYRSQTEVYRKEEDSLHDLDVAYPLTEHMWHDLHPYFRATKAVKEESRLSNEELVAKVKELGPISRLLDRQPNMEILYVYPDASNNVVVNAIVCEDQSLVDRFKRLPGKYEERLKHFTKEEKDKLHIVDIFLNKTNSVADDAITDSEYNLKLANYKHSFRAKLKYGRAKDIFDYQRLNPVNRQYLIDNTRAMQNAGVMYQVNPSTEDSAVLPESALEYMKSEMDPLWRTLQQIDALFDSNLVTSTEVRKIAQQVAYRMSEILTICQENPSEVIRMFSKPSEDLDKIKNKSRKEILDYIGIDKMVAYLKRELFIDNEYIMYADEDVLNKADLFADNIDALVKLGYDTFIQLEGFSIVSNGVTYTTSTEVNTEVQDPNNLNNEDTIKDELGNIQEHWQIESRTLDILNTMSVEMRRALAKCYVLEQDGSIQVTEFGVKNRVQPRDAVNSILRWTQGCLTLSKMIDKLKAKQEANPWISQIIKRLTDDKEVDFKSQFFSTFCKHKQSYSIVRKEGETYSVSSINEEPALGSVIKQIQSLYKIDSHPLFTKEGVNKELLTTLEEVATKLTAMKSVEFDSLDKSGLASLIRTAASILGYDTDINTIEESINKGNYKSIIDNLNYIVDNIKKGSKSKEYNPFNFKHPNSINNVIKNFLRPLTDKLEDTAVSSFFEDGKMYQTYITPSYLSKLFLKFHADDASFKEFLEEEYGKYDWFKHKKDSSGKAFSIINDPSAWRNGLLKHLSTMSQEDRGKLFKHKVQLTFNKHGYMRDMTDTEYTLAIFTEYFSYKDNAGNWAWYRIPMMSNKPSSEYISMPRFTGSFYKEKLAEHFEAIVEQELSRIQTVNKRKQIIEEEKSAYIKNFDDKGDRFHFMDFLNAYIGKQAKGKLSLQNTKLGQLLTKKIEGKLDSIEDNHKLRELLLKEIKIAMDNRADVILEVWEEQGILESAKKVKNISSNKVREELREFIWNDTYAAMNILQLTITDPAYYKNTEDLQKRLAQIHAPGVRGNVEVLDHDGNSVTDKIHRAVYLTDFDKLKSNIIENLRIVFNRKLDGIEDESQRESAKAYYDSIIEKFEGINVADAQAFSCPTSYRKKALIFGKWKKEYDEIYKRMVEGTASMRDLEVVFNPQKPFVYSQIEKDSKVSDGPLTNLKVGVQNKNSEFLLVMADALLKGENTGKPNLLRAIFKVMEESAKANPTKGIDTIEFESAVKAGLQGKVDINQFYDDVDGETKAIVELKKAIYSGYKPHMKSVSGLSYNMDSVHEVPFEDYCIQQEVPEHFKDHEQAHGSQIRAILSSDLEEKDYLGREVEYEYKDGVTKVKKTAKEFKKEFEETISKNIEESINNLMEELGLNSLDMDKKAKNEALSRILQEEILSNPRYGIDLYQACALDKNGNFRIPLGDPIQSKRIEQLINSIIKNKVNKQKIAGGPLVQVSNYGTSQSLNIVFKGKDGNPLKTRKEFEESPIEGYSSYEEYIKSEQNGIAYFECFAPIYSQELFEKFADKNGHINIKLIEKLDPELLMMVGYRIPTEDKYSMAPLKIVGFLPVEAGDGIMLPAEITTLSGSDFDVDKLYVMRKSLNIKTRNKKAIHTDMFALLSSKPKYKKDTKTLSHDIDTLLKAVDVDIKLAKEHPLWPMYVQVAYTVEHPTEGKAYRDNKIVDMTYSVLTHESTADKLLNPGGFDVQSKMGYAIAAYKNADIRKEYSWKDLMNMSVEELRKLSYVDKNLSFIDTHIQFYKQNSVAGQILGMFAVQKTAHALLESNGIYIDINGCLSSNEGIKLGEVNLSGKTEIDPKLNSRNELIGKILGSLVASAADAVKDPVLNLMNINSQTVNVLNTAIRLGVPFETIALMLSQPCITKALEDYSSKKIVKERIRLDNIISERIKILEEELHISKDSPIHEEYLTEEEMILGLTQEMGSSNEALKTEYKTLKTFMKLRKVASNLKGLNYVTRFNAMSNSVGPLVVDNLIMEYKLQEFSEHITLGNNPIDMEDVFDLHPMLKSFKKCVSLARDLLSEMPGYSSQFDSIIRYLPKNLKSAIMNNRDLLKKLSDFFQSYVFAINGTNPARLKYYIEKFPAKFMESEVRKSNLDNPFIAAIKLSTEKGSDGVERAVLKIDTTGLDTEQKEILSCGWVDFYKSEEARVKNGGRVNLAEELFYYNFFRTGLSYSPKTFSSLTPTYVKIKITNYVDTFRKLPSITPSVVVDQFVRNNWQDSQLVPYFVVGNGSYTTKDGKLIITKSDLVERYKDVEYIKINQGGKVYLYKHKGYSDKVLFEMVEPLGDNGRYFEISSENIDKATSASTTLNNVAPETTSDPIDSESDFPTDILDKVFYIAKLISEFMTKEQLDTFNNLSTEQKESKKEAMKEFFRNKMKEKNIKFTEKNIDDIVKQMC